MHITLLILVLLPASPGALAGKLDSKMKKFCNVKHNFDDRICCNSEKCELFETLLC